MAKVSKKAPTNTAAQQAAVEALVTIGLRANAIVRFRRDDGGRWLAGVAVALEPDGSLGLNDARGRRRSIPLTDVEVERRGPRGGKVWVPLCDVAAHEEQLGLF